MIGVKSLSNQTGIWCLVKISLLKPDGKSLDRLRAGPCHQSDNDRRIRSTTQQCAQGNIRDQADADGLRQPPFHFDETLFLAARRMSRVLRQIPILLNSKFASF